MKKDIFPVLLVIPANSELTDGYDELDLAMIDGQLFAATKESWACGFSKLIYLLIGLLAIYGF